MVLCVYIYIYPLISTSIILYPLVNLTGTAFLIVGREYLRNYADKDFLVIHHLFSDVYCELSECQETPGLAVCVGGRDCERMVSFI